MKLTKLSIFCAAALLSVACNSNAPAPAAEAEAAVKTVIEAGEQAPLADPGQKNFGGMHADPKDTARINAERRHRMDEMNRLRTVSFEELSMSDPYIYPDPETKTYYLTSSGGRMWKSKDLNTWEGPHNIIDIAGSWLEKAGFAAAAEIHKIGDYYYYAGTWSDHSDLIQQVPRRYNVPHNQTVLLRSKNVEGPYELFDENPDHNYQPREDDCIDGTLYQEDDKIYMVYVHEWTQIIDGTIEYVELSADLKKTISKPVCIFRASENPSVGEMNSLGEATFGRKMPGWVTDGPQLFRTKLASWACCGHHGVRSVTFRLYVTQNLARFLVLGFKSQHPSWPTILATACYSLPSMAPYSTPYTTQRAKAPASRSSGPWICLVTSWCLAKKLKAKLL